MTCSGGPGVGDGEWLRAIIEYKEEVIVCPLPTHARIADVLEHNRAGLASHITWSRASCTGMSQLSTSTKSGRK